MHRRLRVGGRAVRLPLLLAVCAVLALPASAPAALPAGTLTTFSESWAVPTEKTLKLGLATVTGQCPRPSAGAAQLPPGIELPPGVTLPPGITLPPGTGPTKKPGKLRKVSFAVALRRAQALARSGKAGRLMARLARPLKSEGDARGLAVAAVLGGSPRLMLGGLLAANKRDPRDAMNLVNAAVPLTMLGKPAEALALLDRAAGAGASAAAARPRLANPMGLSGRGVLENNRGYALLKLGRAAEAVAPLRRAIALAGRPLSEAYANLGLALVCSGRGTAEAVKLIRQSYARRSLTYLPPRAQLPGGLIELPESPWAKDVYDLDAAQATPLPQFKWPSTPEQSSNAAERNGAITAASNARSSAISTQLQAAVERRNKLKERTPDKLERAAMANAVNQSDDEPELGALKDKILAAFRDVDTHTEAFWVNTVPPKQQQCLATAAGDPNAFNACFIPWCQSATSAAQGGFNSRMALLDQLARQYWQRAGGREAAIVANLEQPDWHAASLADMQQHGEALWSLLPSAAAGWIGAVTFMKVLCVAGQEPPPDSPAAAANVADPGACPPALQGQTASYGHGVGIPPPRGDGKTTTVDLKLKVGCDKIAVELSGKVKGTGDLLSIFGEGEVDFKRDESTLVVGVKGDLVGLAGAQSGFYVKTGKDGVKDVGWRVGVKVEGKVGSFGLKAWGGTEDISLIGSIDYIPTAFNLR